MPQLNNLILILVVAILVTAVGIHSLTQTENLQTLWESRIAGDWIFETSSETKEYSLNTSGVANLYYTVDDIPQETAGTWKVVPLDQHYALLEVWEEDIPEDESGFKENRTTRSIEYTIRYISNNKFEVLMFLPLEGWFLDEETGIRGMAGWARTDQPRFELSRDWHSRLIGKWDSGYLDSKLDDDGSMLVRYKSQDENTYHSGSWEVQRDWTDFALVRFAAPTLIGFMSEPEPFDVITLLELHMHPEYGEVIITRQYSSYAKEPQYLTRSVK